MKLRNLTKTPYRDLEYYEYPCYYMSCLQGDNGKVNFCYILKRRSIENLVEK